MLEVIRDNLVAIICSGVATFAAGVLVWVVRMFNGMIAAMRADLRDKIRRFGKFYILTGQITMEERNDLGELYDVYHGKLHGNGTAKEIYEQCMELRIVPERTKWNPYYVGVDGFTEK